ncbi:MAG: S46 family peptidase [Flavobacteriales bacterium]|nr:S46 family peptidase [Flavobacteriales bacterium]
MIKRFLLVAWATCLVAGTWAKEGMWIPTLLKVVEGDMQSMGLELSAEDIYSINHSSLKDAIVHFGGGCTAEIISSQGLLLTNHHCGFSQIQSHSSLEHDYLKNGFWAMKRSEELPNPGLTATLIVRIEDVTSLMMKGVKAEMDLAEQQKLMAENEKLIVSKATENTNYGATVRAFNYGNAYYMIVTKTFNDVRLVGAPPSSIGKFGGDTDNWVWPRHTGDFSMFRIYAGADNEPADYNEENKPYQPERHLEVSLDGVEEGDFTMVFGFPGVTEVYLTSHAVDYVMNKSNPMRIHMRETSLSIIDAAMKSSDQIRIQYAAKQSRISNAYKKWIGQNDGLIELKALEKKREDEVVFAQHSAENKALLQQFEGWYRDIEKFSFGRDLLIEYFYYGPEILDLANAYQSFLGQYETYQKDGKLEEKREALIANVEAHFKDYHLPTDKRLFESLTELYVQYIDPSFKPASLNAIDSKFKGDMKAFTEYFYGKSVFSDKEKAVAFAKSLSPKSLKKLQKDPAYVLMDEVYGGYFALIRPEYGRIKSQIDAGMKDYVVRLEEVFTDRTFWSDANSTLRLTYGKAEGSAPRDGMVYKFYTTTDGILQKYKPGHADFDLPPRLIELIEKEDFGPYAHNGEMRVCFTGSNHTTGGNSGSPALNGKGQLVGLNFDRSWESTMSDIMFAPERCRNIMVDIRYVLFIIDKYAGAGHLVQEMTLVKGEKEKAETEPVPVPAEAE